MAIMSGKQRDSASYSCALKYAYVYEVALCLSLLRRAGASCFCKRLAAGRGSGQGR